MYGQLGYSPTNYQPNNMPNKIEVVRMQMGKAGSYQDQFRRPYATNITAQAINQIRNDLDAVGGNPHAMTSGLMNSTATSILTPQINPESQVHVANGWTTERFYFFLELRVFIGGMGGFQTEYVQGYTDLADVSHMGTFDPNMVFHVNSITQTKETTYHTPSGPVKVPSVNNAYQVITNDQFGDIRSLHTGADTHNHSLRPFDIQMSAAKSYMNMDSVLDGRVLNTMQPKSSFRKNGLASSYTSSILSSHAAALQDNNLLDAGPATWTNAARGTAEIPLSRDVFFQFISQANNTSLTNQFTWRDLLRLDPRLGDSSDQRVVVFTAGPVSQAGPVSMPYAAHESERWHGNDGLTHAATIISNGMPGLMIASGFTVVDFLVTNHTVNGQPAWEFTDAQGLAGQDMRGFIANLQMNVMSELINPITFFGQVGYRIRIRCELMYATKMSLQIDTSPEVPFISPTFADALTAPVITNDMSRVESMSHDFMTLVDESLGRPKQLVNLANVQHSAHHFGTNTAADYFPNMQSNTSGI